MPSEAAGQLDVLIVGAGPAGSATATFLARAGLRVAAVDRAAFPRPKPCSEYMSPETVRILDRLGVVGALEQAGAVALEGMRVTAARGAMAHGKFALARHQPFRSTGLSVSRLILDHELVLAARAAGAEVQERTRVEELLYNGGSVAGAVLRDSSGKRRAIHARLTVGADGLRSLVARRIGRRLYGRHRRIAFVAHIGRVEGMGSSAELHFGETGYCGLNRVDRGLTNVACVLPAKRAGDARGRQDQFFIEFLNQFPGVQGRIDPREIAGPVRSTGPFAAWSSRVTTRGGLLVGDAADFFDPMTGDGIYAALRGAELVAEAVVPDLRKPGPLSDECLREYARLRRRAFMGKWMLERMLGLAISFPRLFDRGVDRIGRRDGMAHTAVGVAGGFVPVREFLNPLALARMLV